MTDDQSAPLRAPKLTMEESIRGWADVLCLWRLCRARKCTRAKACRDEADACFRAHFPLLPDSVQIWFAELGAAQEDGLSFDGAIGEMRGTMVEDALERWHEAIRGSRI